MSQKSCQKKSSNAIFASPYSNLSKYSLIFLIVSFVFAIIHLSVSSSVLVSKFVFGSNHSVNICTKLAAFHNFVTNFCPFLNSFSSKSISFQSCHPAARYLTASAHRWSMIVSGSNFAFHFDLLNFSHFSAITNPETMIFLNGISFSLK